VRGLKMPACLACCFCGNWLQFTALMGKGWLWDFMITMLDIFHFEHGQLSISVAVGLCCYTLMMDYKIVCSRMCNTFWFIHSSNG